MPTAQIYIKVDKEATWHDFKTICKANGWKYSDLIMTYVSKIVAHHSGGGSQTLLDSAGLPRTLPRYKTCTWSNKELVKGEFLCTDGTPFWKLPMACDRCPHYQEEDAG